MEFRTIAIGTATQFTVMLGFTVVMPIGPDIAVDLGLPIAHLGLLASSYALAGFVTALGSASLLDRYSRRSPLVAALALIGFATICASFTDNLPMLMLMRAISGACGGICTALLTAIIGDTIAPERRGRAYALVLGTGPLVSIIGLPMAIQLAAIASWRLPLLLLGSTALLITVIAHLALPPMAAHLGSHDRPVSFRLSDALRRPAFRLAMACIFMMTLAFGLLTANNASLLLLNLHLPRPWLAPFYMGAGVMSFGLLRLVGRAADRYGPHSLILPAAASFSGGIVLTYVLPSGPAIGAMAMCIILMSISTLSVSMTTLALQAPGPAERAGFGALIGALQNLASAAGAAVSSGVLVDLPGPRLGNAHLVGLLAIGVAGTLPVFARLLQRQLGTAQRACHAAPVPLPEHPVLREECQCRNGT
jgi:predicted MFS family arabinose efflux permease